MTAGDASITVGGTATEPTVKLPYKVYAALLEAVGAAEPTVTPMGPNTVGNIIWSGSNGVYGGQLAGAFAGGYSKVFVSAMVKDGGPPYIVRYAIDDANNIALYIYDSTFSGSGDVTMCFKIEIYP